ncbi:MULTISPECIES: helix-hairpin-helix domain-containing protein [Haloferacaceae]|uniref:Helix-hairpin-helix domain-containing protein n=1 Tax=Halorubrum glutamatedens TaxID=2707018 RepID=A0ABD5QU95_9EURY|nr:helix-hairpin-helix domain-containing protein [Halobellus captivus]
MSNEELRATDNVHDLADRNAISTAIADRLDDNGFETVADLLIADVSDLEAVPYVGGQRAVEILEAVDGGATPTPEPRDVDFEATESVVDVAIPLSVRFGSSVLATSGASGTNDVYHTTACSVVIGKGEHLVEHDRSWVDDRDVTECRVCQDPEIHTTGSRQGTKVDESRTLVGSREAVLEATLGEKLRITLAARPGWATPWVVVATEEPTAWDTPAGDTWRTRRVRLSESASRRPGAREFDLVVGADGVRIDDPPGVESHQPDAAGWSVESVGVVGRVSTSAYAQLVGQAEQSDDRPEGDDTWRKYQKRGEA